MIIDNQSLFYNLDNTWIWVHDGDYIPPVITNGKFLNVPANNISLLNKWRKR